MNNEELPEADDLFTPDAYDDTYMNMELALPRASGEAEFGRVVKRMRDKDGLPIGTANDNPLVDSRVYKVEFLDGHKSAVANIIVENLFAQLLLCAIRRNCGTPYKRKGIQATRRICHNEDRDQTQQGGIDIWLGSPCQVENGSTTWVALKDFKESYPVQLAEYAVSTRIVEEPAFAW